MTLTLQDPLKRGLIWPQRMRVTLGYDGSDQGAARLRDGCDDVCHGAQRVWLAPRYVLPNGGGLGYGLFVLDDASRDYLLRARRRDSRTR